jgi:steroid delta-isomerase-like uncharacterized protein
MPDKNEAVVRQMFEEVWNQRKLSAIERFFDKDYVNHDPMNPTHGLAAYTNVVKKYHTAFPDCRLDISEAISAGNNVVVRWRYSGTHRGPLEGMSPTGRHAEGTGITICRFSGDRIHEAFVNWDALGLMQQLGAVTMPGRAASARA